MDKNRASDSYSPGYCEYLVEGFAGKKTVAIRLCSVVAGLVLLALLFGLLSFIPQVFAVWFVLIMAAEIIVFKFTKCEFEYTVAMGEFSIDIIYGKRWRRTLIKLRIADADKIFKITGLNDERVKKLNADRIVIASPKKSEWMYCLFTKNDGGSNSKTAVIFSSCNKLNDSLKFYNRSALAEIQ